MMITKNEKFLEELNELIKEGFKNNQAVILPPMDVTETIKIMHLLDYKFTVTMIDPWYNKGIGGEREDYVCFITSILALAGNISQHVFLWGFPEIVARFIERIPEPLRYVCWLTWYYKNNPSVIRGWRSAQQTCLHLPVPDAKLYPEHFLNEKQKKLKEQGKLRYMPGPPSVIEAPLNIGFVGKNEQTGHPSQKPESVYEKLYRMTTTPGDWVLDPMAGSGTTGAVASKLGFFTILCDKSEQYTRIMENRLGIKRLRVKTMLKELLKVA